MTSRYPAQDSRPSGSLLLSREAVSSSTACRVHSRGSRGSRGSVIVPNDMIKRIRVSGYRPVRELELEPQPINVLTGPNGCGKSNLYNSLVPIGRAPQGQLAHAIAEEGEHLVYFGLAVRGFAIRERSHRNGSYSGSKGRSSAMRFRSDFRDLTSMP